MEEIIPRSKKNGIEGIATAQAHGIGATGFEQARQLVQKVTKNDIINLYRSVGAEEYLDIQKTLICLKTP